MTLIELIRKHTTYADFEAELNSLTIDESVYKADKDGNTAFHHLVMVASQSKSSETYAYLAMTALIGDLRVLEDNKIDINAKNRDGLSALALSDTANCVELKKFMLALRAIEVPLECAKSYIEQDAPRINKLAEQADEEAKKRRPPVLFFTPGPVASSSDQLTSNKPAL